MPTILLTNFYSTKVLEIVKKQIPKGFDFISLEESSKERLIEIADEADFFLASGRIPLDREVIDAAVKLKMVQRTGVGVDTVDLVALKERGIPVYVNPGINSISVAEHTIMLIFSVLRRLPVVDRSLRSGTWKKNDVGIESCSLNNKVVGLIGMGNIGRHVSTMLIPFGVKCLYYDPYRLDINEERKYNIDYCDFENILKHSDILSLHCPLTVQTREIIGKVELALMKPGSFIINTGRGPLINEVALIESLRSGHIRGAGLDVFYQEPPASDNQLLQLENVVLTPHVGGLTLETFSKMMRDAFENIRSFENGFYDLIEHRKLQ